MFRTLRLGVMLMCVVFLVLGTAVAQEMEEMGATEEMSFTLTSSAFEDGQRIPGKYTCTGMDVTPPLAWSGVPEGCVSLAIIMDDPDAPGGTWVHWVIWNIDPALGGLDEALDAEAIGAVLGKNSWGKAAYGGPCPPSGVHRYRFTIYALSDYPDINPGASKSKLKRTIRDITLAEYTLMGTYSK